jgi:glycosyltransferase involved in cell wall biosynthesis
MKVVQAVGWYFPQSLGGTEIYVAGLCRRLQAAGHTVLVAAPLPGAAAEQRYEHDGVPVFRYPTPASPSRSECQALHPVPGAERFHHWLARERPDVVHFHTFVTGLGLHEVKAAKAIGARVIVTTHASSLGYTCQRGTMMRWGRELCDGVCEPAKCAACELQNRGLPQSISGLVANIPPHLGRLFSAIPGKAGTALGMSWQIARNQCWQLDMLEHLDKFVLLTQWALDAVASNGAPRGKLALNRLGLSQGQLERKPGPDAQPTLGPVRIGYLGRYEHVKGVRQFAESIACLPRELALQFEFRGPANSAEERALLQEVKNVVGTDERVRFAPAVTTADVPALLAGYDVLCCPSICLEGGPTVAIEAYGVGTPVIGSRIGGLAELVTDGVNGRLTPPGDVAALARVLREIAADPTGTVDTWRRALPRVRTMDNIAADYLALYRA